MIVKYLASERPQKGRTLLENIEKTADTRVVSKEEHSLMRNAIIMELVISNVSRAGCITELTTEDVMAATNVISRGQNVMQVR